MSTHSHSGNIRCPNCGRDNPEWKTRCAQCGTELVPNTQPQATQPNANARPKTLICPQCGNINAFDADTCLKCGLALAPIRDAMGKINVAAPPETMPMPAKPKEPVPTMPQLTPRPTEEKIGNFVDSWRFLIRGMGDRSNEIAARFFKQLETRGIDGLKLSVGKLIIEIDGNRTDSRDYYFAERDLGKEALATMAVRIAPVGTDTFVEWRHYTTPPMGAFNSGIFYLIMVPVVCILCILLQISRDLVSGGAPGTPVAMVTLLAMGIVVIVGIIVGASIAKGKSRKNYLEGFQTQDSTAFQFAVRAALEEAIDLAGISKALIQDLSNEKDKGRRVI